jgi:transposase InsO family protein
LFPTQAKFRAEHALDLVHGDICGPVTPATLGGKKYFLLLVDDYSHFMWLLLMAAKSDAPAAIKRFQAAAELESGRTLKILHTDYGGEFTSLEFGDYCSAKGLQRHHSAPYSPQQNGIVERCNQIVVVTARSLLKQRSMPAKFWGEAVSTAVFLLNRVPTKALNGRMPYEAWYDKKPAVSSLRTFGCLAIMKKTRPHQSKLEDRSTAVVFIGYEAGTKAYSVQPYVPACPHHERRGVRREEGMGLEQGGRSSRWRVADPGVHHRVNHHGVQCS